MSINLIWYQFSRMRPMGSAATRYGHNFRVAINIAEEASRAEQMWSNIDVRNERACVCATHKIRMFEIDTRISCALMAFTNPRRQVDHVPLLASANFSSRCVIKASCHLAGFRFEIIRAGCLAAGLCVPRRLSTKGRRNGHIG